MLNHILNALGAVGNVLDLPGSSLRDVLAGQNPFDQYLTPFTSEKRFSGRDLLRHHGLIGQHDTWGNFAGGLATETLLDPTNVIGGGFLKHAFTRQNAIKKAHAAIAALNPLEPGFTPEIIRALTGANVKPFSNATDLWKASLTDAEKEAAKMWTGKYHGAMNAVERGGEIHPAVKWDLENGNFPEEFGGRTKPIHEDSYYDLPYDEQQKIRNGLAPLPEYTPENIKALLNEPLKSAINKSKAMNDAELVRAHVNPMKVGEIAHDPGFFATSSQRNPTGSHDLNIFYDRNPEPGKEIANVVVKKGTKAAPLTGMGGGFSNVESEVLLHKPYLRVLAKRELPLIKPKGAYSWEYRRGTGIGNYVNNRVDSNPRLEQILSGAIESPGLDHATQANYLLQVVPKNFRAPLAERIPLKPASALLASHALLSRSGNK